MPDMGESRSARPHPVVWIGWLAVGLSWIAAQFLPWATRGALSRSSLLDAARFASEDSIAGWLPPGAAYVALAPVATGLLLVGLAGIRGRTALAARLLAGLAGAVVVVVLAVQVRDLPGGGDGVGTGAIVALVGVLLAVLAGAGELVLRLVGNRAIRPRSDAGSH